MDQEKELKVKKKKMLTEFMIVESKSENVNEIEEEINFWKTTMGCFNYQLFYQQFELLFIFLGTFFLLFFCSIKCFTFNLQSTFHL